MSQHAGPIIANRSRGETNDPVATQKRGILLVEDYNPNIVMMTMFFETLGYECDIARNGFEALDRFFMSSYDLVIMDLQLPDIDGLETTRRVRLWERGRNLSPTPILAASGSSSEDEKLFCLKAGMNDCLAKPFQLDELEKKLSQWIPRPAT